MQHETPDPPRRLNSEVPRDLEVICLKAMAKEPNRRYANAAELHDDLRCWLEGRSISARPAGRVEKSVLWSRRNPLAVALMAVFLIGFVASVWGWWRAGVKADEAAMNAETANKRKTEADDSAALATRRKDEADANAALATKREAEAKASAALATKRKDEADASAALAIKRHGEAVAARQKAEEHSLLALGAINTLVFKAQQLADAAPGTLALKRELAEAALTDLRALAASGDNVPGADRTRLAAIRKLAETFLLLGRADEAIAEYEKAVALATNLGKASPDDASLPRDLATSLVRISYIHRRLGVPVKASEDLRQAIEALAAARKIAPTDLSISRELAVAYNARADVEQEAGNSQNAIADYERSLAIVERLAEAAPEQLLFQSDLRFTHARLGLAHAIAMNFAAADRHYKDAETAAARGLAINPKDPNARREWHISLLDRADAQTRLGDYAGAEVTARAAIKELEPVARAEADNVFAQRNLAIGYSLLGVALIGLDRFAEGQKELERSLVLREKAFDQARGTGLTAADIPVIAGLLIVNAERMQRFEEAAKWCDHVAEFVSKLQGGGVKDLGVIATLDRLAIAKEAYTLAPKAVADAGFAKSQKPEYIRLLLCFRAGSLARTGKHDEALAAIDEVKKEYPNDFDVLVGRACLYSYVAKSTTDAKLREKRLEVAHSCLADIARMRPGWFGDIAFYPELLAARKDPKFTERVVDVVRKAFK